MRPADQQLVKQWISWGYQTVNYSLQAAYCERQNHAFTAAEVLAAAKASEATVRELWASTLRFAESSNKQVALDITFFIYAFNWSAAHRGFRPAKAKRWWFRRRTTASILRPAAEPIRPRPGQESIAPELIELMKKWGYQTIDYCTQTAKLEADRTLAHKPELLNSAREAQETLNQLWDRSIKHCRAFSGPVAFDAYFLTHVLDWCAQRRGLVR